MKFYENWKFWNFLKISEFSLINEEVRVSRINIKLLSNPVAELKIRVNDSHCRSIVIKTMDRSIVKQLEKEKNSNFNVENFVVMFIYWGTIYTYLRVILFRVTERNETKRNDFVSCFSNYYRDITILRNETIPFRFVPFRFWILAFRFVF
jgi:hypothetical protein